MVQIKTPPSDHLAPIVAVVAERRIEASVLRHGDIASDRSRVPPGRAVLIIADDLEVSLGPPGFHSDTLRWLLGRATHVAVMAGAPVPAIYARAVRAAVELLAFVVIAECQESTQADWLAAMRRWAPRASKLLVTPVPSVVRMQ